MPRSPLLHACACAWPCACAVALLAAACEAPPLTVPASPPSDVLLCERPLAEGCCGVDPPCYADWATAQGCGVSPGATVYGQPCDGFVALGFGEELRVYEAAEGNLAAFVDEGALAACNMGPASLPLSQACLATWRASGGTPCLPLPPGSARVICPPPGDGGADGAADAGGD
jgi:hypothetical protein